jgi:hypothetical protein
MHISSWTIKLRIRILVHEYEGHIKVSTGKEADHDRNIGVTFVPKS